MTPPPRLSLQTIYKMQTLTRAEQRSERGPSQTPVCWTVFPPGEGGHTSSTRRRRRHLHDEGHGAVAACDLLKRHAITRPVPRVQSICSAPWMTLSGGERLAKVRGWFRFDVSPCPLPPAPWLRVSQQSACPLACVGLNLHNGNWRRENPVCNGSRGFGTGKTKKVVEI